ncbi:MAG TPA: hypothetical protein VL359_17550 [bacterium]|nr:hypothetical protein [bacterium]
MKRLLVLVAAMLLLWQTHAWAQEREPLAMRIELEWTVAGTIMGALVGAALWLTDPANPNLTLARQVIESGTLGTFAGAAFGLYVLQRSAQFPVNAVQNDAPVAPWLAQGDPPAAALGAGSDPIAARMRGQDLLDYGRLQGLPTGLPLATLRLRF